MATKTKEVVQEKNWDEMDPAPNKIIDELDAEESGCDYTCSSLMPAFQEKNVAVCMVSSDEYAPFAGVLAESIISNASAQNNYDIIILSDDMLLRNRWRIEAIAECKDNISIRIIDISEMVSSFSFYTWAHFTSNTYYRLLTPDVFCNYKKIIYLDSDTVVNQDIAELFATDLEGYLIAAAYDTHVVAYCSQIPPKEQREYNIKTLGLTKPEEYYQAGVSIFNVEAINKEFKPGYLIEKASEIELRWLDQDLLNMLFKGRIKTLSNKWNVMVADVPFLIDEYYLPPILRKEYYEARRNPSIVHYVGRAIPCYTQTPDLYEYFWKYARNTVFYEILLQRMSIQAADKIVNERFESLNQYLYIREQHEKMYAHYQNSLSNKLRRRLRSVIDRLLPLGTKRRDSVRRVYYKLRGWQ